LTPFGLERAAGRQVWRYGGMIMKGETELQTERHTERRNGGERVRANTFISLFVFGATTPSGPGPPHSRGF